ncbi:hypothetical protein ACHAPT_000123 [Fusarium lateritium]
MAVLAEVPHVSVHVKVAGEVATEHEAPSDQAPVVGADPELPTAHYYIEAQTGAEFSVEMTVNSAFSFPRGSNGVNLRVLIDGSPIAAMITSASRQGTTNTIAITGEAAPDGDIASEIERAKDLGVVKVMLSTAWAERYIPWNPSSGILLDDDRELPEKALKGRELSHRVSYVFFLSRYHSNMLLTKCSLAPGTRQSVPMGVDIRNEKQIGAIYFHYRSHVTSSPAGVDLSNLSEGEIRRLAGERLRDLQVKEESRRVKREAESAPREIQPLKVIRLEDGTEAFDLTED